MKRACSLPLISCSLVCTLLVGSSAVAAPTLVFPDAGWEEATPESQGVDGKKLDEATRLLARTVGSDGVRELVIIRHGRMIWKGDNIDKRHGVWSATKSFTSTVLGLLIEDGKCTLDTRVANVLPELKQHYADATLRHFTTMTSGYRAVGDETTGSYKHGPSNTPFQPNPKPLFTPPGSQYAYWDSAMNTLGLALTKIAGEPIEELFRRRIAHPIGMRDWDWGDYATVNGVVVNGGSGNGNKHIFITARELARFGLLFLNQGNWNGRQLVSAKWVAEATRVHVPATMPWAHLESDIDGRGVYGFNWWRNGVKPDGTRKFPAAPEGMFWASGHNNNKCFVIPEWNMVIVRLGLDGQAKDEVWDKSSPTSAPRSLNPVETVPREQALFQTMKPIALLVLLFTLAADAAPRTDAPTRIAIHDGRWMLDGHLTHPGRAAEGLLINVRMVNATFEDRRKPDFDAKANTDRFIARIPDYAAQGVNAFTLCLQGGMPGYEGAENSAFEPDGGLQPDYLTRVERVIRACDRSGMAVILGLYYQRQSAILRDETAVRAGVVNTARWVRARGFQNVMLEIANEYPHKGFARALIRDPKGQASLIRLAKETAPGLLVSASGYGDGKVHAEVAEAADFLLPHWNGTPVAQIPARIKELKRFGKPIVGNEDDKTGTNAVAALLACVANRASYGLMLKQHNQTFPFHFDGAADDPLFYAELGKLTTVREQKADVDARDYFPPPESQGGWRKLENPDEIRRLAGMNPEKLAELREWLLKSDNRNFAAVVIRNGAIALEVERGNSAKTDARRVASVSKAVCATVLAIASERSQQGRTPLKMSFEDRAFDFIPWAQPLSDPRKASITVKQLLNHTSGICPEATGAPNDGSWEYLLGHSGDARTAKLAFDPGTGCGYSSHALAHAALVCETVTGRPYDQFAIEALFKPLGIEHWWFQYYEGGGKIGRHPSHGLGMPARDLARIAYCMMRGGRWGEQQVIPKWFVNETAAPTHDVTTPEMRWKLNPQVFSHGWELPARHKGEDGRSGEGIPADARSKPGSGGQLIAFVPSLDLVITRQTGSSGQWEYEEYLRRACAAVLPDKPGP